MIQHVQIFKASRSICDWQSAKSNSITEDFSAACARLVDKCIQNGSFNTESKDPEQPFKTEMFTFKRDKHVFHASMLGEFYLVAVCD